mmetsp:Transcript_19474/g.24005  ORF Transcript_19474/g.24005 Transcript_19474/m.24005 type:complete len:216 (-) Transcript_19474:394-1041(-)
MEARGQVSHNLNSCWYVSCSTVHVLLDRCSERGIRIMIICAFHVVLLITGDSEWDGEGCNFAGFSAAPAFWLSITVNSGVHGECIFLVFPEFTFVFSVLYFLVPAKLTLPRPFGLVSDLDFFFIFCLALVQELSEPVVGRLGSSAHVDLLIFVVVVVDVGADLQYLTVHEMDLALVDVILIIVLEPPGARQGEALVDVMVNIHVRPDIEIALGLY